MKEKRYYTAGIVYDKVFHLFGGYDGSSRLKTSEVVSENGITYDSPDLPDILFLHAIASINNTVSIITGGSSHAYSPHHEGTLYFNHVTQEFIPGPNLLEDRRGHASGTITDQETGERIVVIAGGKNSYYLDSTELLLDGEWHAGKNSHTVTGRVNKV